MTEPPTAGSPPPSGPQPPPPSAQPAPYPPPAYPPPAYPQPAPHPQQPAYPQQPYPQQPAYAAQPAVAPPAPAQPYPRQPYPQQPNLPQPAPNQVAPNQVAPNQPPPNLTPNQPPPGQPPARPRRHRGLFWAAVLVAVVAVAAGSLFAVTSYFSASRPDGVVRSYFAALSRGDAPTALGFGDLPAGTSSWLTSDVLRAQDKIAPLSDLAVLSVDQHGDRADVDVQYTLGFSEGARQVSDTVAVTHQGHRWRLDQVAVPVTLTVPDAANLARVAGAALPHGSVLLFPGALPVQFATASLMLDQQGSVVRFAAPGAVTVQVTVTAAAAKTIKTAVSQALTSCLAGGAKADPRCPMPDDDRAVPDTLRGTPSGSVSNAVQVRVSGANGTIDVNGLVTINGSYQQLDFNNLPVTKKGNQTVELSAQVAPDALTKIVWRVA